MSRKYVRFLSGTPLWLCSLLIAASPLPIAIADESTGAPPEPSVRMYYLKKSKEGVFYHIPIVIAGAAKGKEGWDGPGQSKPTALQVGESRLRDAEPTADETRLIDLFLGRGLRPRAIVENELKALKVQVEVSITLDGRPCLADEYNLVKDLSKPSGTKWMMASRSDGLLGVYRFESQEARDIYVLPDLLAVETMFGDIGGMVRITDLIPQTLRHVITLDGKLLGSTEYTLIRSNPPTGEVIVDYSSPLISKCRSSRRLVLDTKRMGSDPRVRWAAIDRGFAPASKPDEMARYVSRADFKRLKSISLDATNATGVVIRGEVAMTTKSRFHPESDMPLVDPAEVLLQLSNEAQRAYAGPNEKRESGHVYPISDWVRDLEMPDRFSRKQDTEMPELMVGGRLCRLPKRVVPSYASLLDPAHRPVFVLVEADSPYYVQQFETTIAEWKRFLRQRYDEQDQGWLLEMTELQKDSFHRITGMRPTVYLKGGEVDQKLLEIYLYLTAIRREEERRAVKKKNHTGGQNPVLVDSFAVELLERIAARDDDLPMTMISLHSAREFARWVSRDAKVQSKAQWENMSKRAKRTDHDYRKLASLSRLRATGYDRSDQSGGDVYGLARNVAELTLNGSGAKAVHTIKGSPYFGGEDWGAEVRIAEDSQHETEWYVGLRLVVPAIRDSPSNG